MTIVAGVGENKNIVKASKEVDFPVELVNSAEEFIEAIKEDRGQGYVRGSLGSWKIMAELKKKYGEFYRVSCVEVKGHKFFLAPVGIDEGDNLEQKLQIIEYGIQFLEKLDIKDSKELMEDIANKCFELGGNVAVNLEDLTNKPDISDPDEEDDPYKNFYGC